MQQLRESRPHGQILSVQRAATSTCRAVQGEWEWETLVKSLRTESVIRVQVESDLGDGDEGGRVRTEQKEHSPVPMIAEANSGDALGT